MLIGYRGDLDKDLVQAYSNTGVVHIIAISGLHIGMIYALLAAVFAGFKRYRLAKYIRAIIILLVLWTFTLVAGAAPSILRSAVMFSFIVLGELINRKTNIYNTLAASAFCMLLFDPFALWDVGFQLSYAAVISIITFMTPIYKLLYFPNRLLDKIWSLTAVTLSAQLLTVPIVLFYFHQFPNFFLVTNLLIVPWSGLILYGEILLLVFSLFASPATTIGCLLNSMIAWMNLFIERINYLPFAVWKNFQINVLQTWLLYGIIIALVIWLMQQSKRAFLIACAFATILALSVSIDLINRNNQRQLIVYNAPKMSAIDLVEGKYFHFTGDTILRTDQASRNFYMEPTRMLNHATTQPDSIIPITPGHILNISKTRILLIDDHCRLPRTAPTKKIPVDLIILSKNPGIYVSQLTNFFDVKTLVSDGSNPLWKTALWKKDCDSLHLRFHSTADNGAFVMDL